jgi:hypothetical protein
MPNSTNTGCTESNDTYHICFPGAEHLKRSDTAERETRYLGRDLVPDVLQTPVQICHFSSLIMFSHRRSQVDDKHGCLFVCHGDGFKETLLVAFPF